MVDRKKKRERQKYKYLNIWITKRVFLDETKNIFRYYLKAVIWWKMKIADTGFKLSFNQSIL